MASVTAATAITLATKSLRSPNTEKRSEKEEKGRGHEPEKPARGTEKDAHGTCEGSKGFNRVGAKVRGKERAIGGERRDDEHDRKGEASRRKRTFEQSGIRATNDESRPSIAEGIA